VKWNLNMVIVLYIEFVRTNIIEESSKVTGIRNLVIRSRIELWTCLFSYVKIHLLDSCSKSPGSVPQTEVVDVRNSPDS
jgi:hypothetical protein